MARRGGVQRRAKDAARAPAPFCARVPRALLTRMLRPPPAERGLPCGGGVRLLLRNCASLPTRGTQGQVLDKVVRWRAGRPPRPWLFVHSASERATEAQRVDALCARWEERVTSRPCTRAHEGRSGRRARGRQQRLARRLAQIAVCLCARPKRGHRVQSFTPPSLTLASVPSYVTGQLPPEHRP